MEDKKSSLYALSNKMKTGWNDTETQIKFMPPPAEKVSTTAETGFDMTYSVMETPYSCTGLAMATVPSQKWIETYDPDLGFERGTIFPCLDYPFMGEGACPRER